MISYFSEVRKGNQIYSCDMIRISFLSSRTLADDLERFINFECACRPDVSISPIDTRFAHYKYFVNFTYSENAVVKCGYGFNGARGEDSFRGFIEFNPNKVLNIQQFVKDFSFLRGCFGDYDVKRIDIAVDLIGSNRDNVFVRKDSRRYKLDAGSSIDKTEYLGKRNTAGRVKVYNKTLESNLSYPCTRIEITTEPSIIAFRRHIPSVYDFSIPVQQELFSQLNSTDKALLTLFYKAIVNDYDKGMMIFNSLARVKRKKLEPFLLPDNTLVKYDEACVRQVFDNISGKLHLYF